MCIYFWYFWKILHKYQIILNLYIKGDHNALGVIDAYAKRLKLHLAKYVLRTDNEIEWNQLLCKVVSNSNNTPTDAIIEAFETILNDNKDNYPKIIMADQDSVFTSDDVQKNIRQIPNYN